MDFKLKKSNLNLKVYSAAELPSTGNENDICVISSVPMPNWILSPDEPSGAPRSDGDVWIEYSVTGNTFNALKNNSMMITAISAKQYIGGAWVDKTAKIYQSGKWVDLIACLYNNGTEVVAWAGAWHEKDDCLYGTGSDTNALYHYTEKKYDITQFKKLYCLAKTVKGTGAFYDYIRLGIATTVSDTSVSSVAEIAFTEADIEETAWLGLADRSGEYYIYVKAPRGGNKDTKGYVYKIWFE